MNREQLESQLSAMYDGELPAAECELLARRLVREEPLRATWSRYAVIGAALRSEPVARVRPDFARRVSERLVEATGEQGASGTRRRGGLLLRRAGLGAGIAAGVAGAAILMLRHGVDLGISQGAGLVAGIGVQAQGNALVASAGTGAVASRPATAASGNDGVPAMLPSLRAGRGTWSSLDMHASNEPASYVVPPAAPANGLAVPVALADYVLAHSEVSSPLVRRSLISSLVASDALEPAVAAGPRSGATPTVPAADPQR